MPIALPDFRRMTRPEIMAWLITVPDDELSDITERIVGKTGGWFLKIGDLAREERTRRAVAPHS
jgi:hypothetical protein